MMTMTFSYFEAPEIMDKQLFVSTQTYVEFFWHPLPQRALTRALITSGGSQSGIPSVCIITGGGEVVSAFRRLEGWQQFTDCGPEAFEGALCPLAQKRLELCEGIFDGVEVRTVRREVL